MHAGNISSRFSWYEVEHSSTAERLGIDNTVPTPLVPVVENTAVNLEFIRTLLANPILVDSWYRCPELQKLPEFLNPTSQHPKGEAVDFISPRFGTPLEICRLLLQHTDIVRFDQLILEHTWVHISFASGPGAVQRKQVLSLLNNKKYTLGLTNPDGVAYK